MRNPVNPWPGVLLRVALVAGAGGVLGLIFGHVSLWVLFGTWVYLAWQLNYLLQLERWVRHGGRSAPPQAPGVWGDIFDGLYRFQQRHRQRRQNLAGLVTSFRASANAMPDATIILREHGEMQWWNAAAKRFFGLRWPQDEGLRIDNLLRHPAFRTFLEDESDQDTIALPSPIDDEVILEIRVVPYGDRQRLLLARDITRLHRLERMRRDFVANISHELRTPLTVIRGLAETMADDEAQSPENHRALTLIEQQTLRMRRLVDDLLLLSRLETEERKSEPQRVNVPVILEGLVEEAKALSGRADQVIDLELDSRLLLRGDESELRSAFSNLVFNAIKYTPAGGRIGIRWYQAGSDALFSVTDTGVGISGHHIPRLTERFYRVDSSRTESTGGTGLGLAIVKHVLSRHDAHLDVKSKPGEGSCFSCRFPSHLVIRTGA